MQSVFGYPNDEAYCMTRRHGSRQAGLRFLRGPRIGRHYFIGCHDVSGEFLAQGDGTNLPNNPPARWCGPSEKRWSFRSFEVGTRTSMRTVELIWRSPKALIARIDGRVLNITGAESIEGDIHYYISSGSITKWADGEPLDPDERGSILRDVVTAARERGWNFVID
jgi:hypothetical protein